MFVNQTRSLKGCYSSTLWNLATPLKSRTVNFTRLSCHCNISTQHNNPRRSPPTFLQLFNLRSFSVTSRSRNVQLDSLSKTKELGEHEWYPPLSTPTERMEYPAYTYLRNHPDYQNLFFQPGKYSELMTEDGSLTSKGEKQVNPAVKSFIDLCNSNPNELITDPKYEPFFAELISQSSQLTDVDLLLVFFNFRRFSNRPKGNDKNYRKIWQPLDHLCLLRIQQQTWNSNLEYFFHLADLLHSVGLSTKSKFHWDLLKRLYRRVDSLSKEEFIRMMVCWGAVDKLPDVMSLYNVEYNLPKFIDQLSSAEVAVISIAFNRTQTCVHNIDLLRKMLQIVSQDAQYVVSPNVSVVCKVIIITKFANSMTKDIYEFLSAFVPQIPRLDVHACATLMSMGLKRRVKHEELCKAVLNKLEGKVEFIRGRDLEHICNNLGSFNIECDQFFGEVVEDFRRRIASMSTKDFSITHGRSLVPILVNLCMRNIIPVDLISLALSEDFLRYTFGRTMYTYTQEVVYLDICAGIEVANYDGPRLSAKYREFLTKKNMLWVEDEKKAVYSEYQKTARSMLALCVDSLGGPEFCHICNIVPPFRTIGVVYCLRESDNKPVPVPENFTAIEDFQVKYIPEPAKDGSSDNNNMKFHAFVLFPLSQATNNTHEPTGMAVIHCRQMKKLGFIVHPIYLGHTVTNPTEMEKFVSEVLGIKIPEEPKLE